MGGTRIRAAVCREFGAPLAVEEVLLDAPGPEEVRVAIAACAICHSDLSYLDGSWGGDLPAVWGHEAAGQVVELGAGVADLDLGDPVVVTLIRSCGSCHRCRRGEQVGCTTTFRLDEQTPLHDVDGAALAHGLRTAAFAEQVVVHRSQVAGYPPALDPAAAALLACGALTGVGAVTNTASVERGSSVVVVGAGGVGLNVVQGARLAGAEPIIAIDPLADKRAAAERFGATDSIDPTAGDQVEGVADLTEGRLADYVFVATGARPALAGAGRLVGAMGALVIVGMPPDGVTIDLDPGSLAAANQRILGSKMGTSRVGEDVPRLIAHHQAGKLELEGLVTGRYPLDSINQAIEGVRRGEALRNVIVFETEEARP